MSDDNTQDQAGQDPSAEVTQDQGQAAGEQAFPGTSDTRTVEEVDAQIKDANAAPIEAAPVEPHPAHGVLDTLENEINALGGFAVSKLKHLVDQIRGLI